MRRGNLIMAVMAVAAVAFALVVQRVDVTTGQARYWQHEQQPSEDELPQEEGAPSKGTEELRTHLPIVRVETDGQKIPGKTIVDEQGQKIGYETGNDGEEEIPVTFSTVDGNGVWHHAGDASSDEGTASFRVRGNSSRRFDKSSYLLRITESYGSEEEGSQGLLGMAPGTKWALYGPYLDKTLVRNYLCLNLCGDIMDTWVPEVRFCELLIDGKYQGVYVLMEMIEVQQNRLNLREAKEGELTNSYLVRIERDEQDPRNIQTFADYTYRTEGGRAVQLLYPGLSGQTERVRNYTQANIDEVERMFYANDIEGWMAQVDLQSFVDYYLIEEFAAINDMFSASTYFYRDVRGRFTIGPVWDFNNAFNNFFTEMPTREFILSKRGWFSQLMRSEEFVERTIARWRELRRTTLSDHELRSRIYSVQDWLGSAVGRNFEVWGYTFDASQLMAEQKRLPDVEAGQTDEDVNPSSYDEATEWMVNYMLNRARWMDENIYTLRQYCHPSKNV